MALSFFSWFRLDWRQVVKLQRNPKIKTKIVTEISLHVSPDPDDFFWWSVINVKAFLWSYFHVNYFYVCKFSDDHSRVILKPVNGDIHDDYTNANYIEVMNFILMIKRETSKDVIVSSFKARILNKMCIYCFRVTKRPRHILQRKVRLIS